MNALTGPYPAPTSRMVTRASAGVSPIRRRSSPKPSRGDLAAAYRLPLGWSLRRRQRVVQRMCVASPRATVFAVMNETRTLARFVADTRFADLPRGLVENCKIAVLDALGAGFVGDQLTSAMGIAGSSSAGLLEFAWSGGDTKRLHLGRASQLGLESALLAREGVRGPATVLEGRSGYFNAFSTPPRMEKLVEKLGADWAIEPPSLKSYAPHVTQQAVVQAIQDLKREHPLAPGAIPRVVIRGAPRIMEERHTERAPHDVLGGQYSLPFTTAVALPRDMGNPPVYDDAAVHDPSVRDLARRIELQPVEDAGHETPGVWPAEILVECAGRHYTLRTRPHKGAPTNPFTWDEVCEKFQRYTASVVSAAQTASLIDAVGRLEQVADIADVAELISLT